MKCSKCGKEIAPDSNFCEYCGNPVKKSYKKIIWITFITMLVLYVGGMMIDVVFGGEEKKVDEDILSVKDYVDLGLSSGTLWKTVNETGFYTYEEAVSQFGTRLPTKGQWEELEKECQWQWTGSGYKVTGTNGNTMTLPAAGFNNHDYYGGGVKDEGSDGHYWSSTPSGSEYAWYLYFFSYKVYMQNLRRYHGRSVRLVQD